MGGATFDQLTGEDETPSHVYTTIVLSAAFVLGFTTVFVILGATATAAGQLLANNLALLAKIAGDVIFSRPVIAIQRLDQFEGAVATRTGWLR